MRTILQSGFVGHLSQPLAVRPVEHLPPKSMSRLIRTSPPRRHLVYTSLCVAGLHLALLGAPRPAVSSPGDVTSLAPTHLPTTPGGDAGPLAPLAPVSHHRVSSAPGSLSVRVAHLAPAAPVAPTFSTEASPAFAEAELLPAAEPASTSWTLAQANVESEPSLRPNASESKAQPPVKLPGSARLQFDVLGKIKGFGYTVSGELTWQQDGRQYQSRYEIGMPLLGSRVQTSQGQIGAGGLMPTRFGDKVRSEQAAHFERDKGLISFSANTPSAALEPGAQDRLSLFLQLASLLAGAPQRYPTGTLITLQIVSAREAEPWTFRVDAAETLQLPLGPIAAVRLTRQPRQPYDQQVDLWFAPSMGYLPVRLRVTHPNGDVADQVLRRLEPTG